MPKKRANGDGTIRQRSDGRWEGRYNLGRDPGTGKQVQKSIYGKTKAEVAQKIRAITHEIDQGIYTAPTKFTVGKWLDTWHAEYLGSVKPSTAAQYSYLIRVHLKPAMGAVKLSDLAAPMIQKLYNDSLRNGLSPKSVRNMHGVLHKALHQAMKLGYIRTNPCLACELPRVERKEMQTIHTEQLGEFLRAIRQDEYADIYFMDVFTGLRQGEILGLTWDCVDFERGTLTVKHQLQKERGKGGKHRLVSLKTDKTRMLTLAPSVVKLLRNVQLQQKENRLKAGSAWDNPMDLVFTNELGGHLSSVTVYNHFKRIARQMGLPELRFHDMRHTFAELSLENGDDIKTISENLGHSTIITTMDVYGHVAEKLKKDSAARMQALIDRAKA